jgi:hypothetical protein
MPVSPWISSTCICQRSMSRNNKTLVDEITTLRRHLEAAHSVSDTSTFLGVY